MTETTEQILKAVVRILGFAAKMLGKVLKKEPI